MRFSRCLLLLYDTSRDNAPHFLLKADFISSYMEHGRESNEEFLLETGFAPRKLCAIELCRLLARDSG
jgi:hypothetical protein